MPEDLQKEYEQLIQKETDAFTKKIDELVSAKEKEMMTVYRTRSIKTIYAVRCFIGQHF